jgi:histidine triad (HIT) family protein
MNDCIFCKISSKEAPADIQHETDALMAFTDIHPKAPVHLLIVPKKHVQSIADLTEGDRPLISAMIYAAKDMAREQNLKGYRLCFNVGREGGQIVDHLHLHLLGGWQNGEDGKTLQ